MAIGLFKKQYTVRKFGTQTVKCGYAASPFTDKTIRLNVQPLSSDELMALPEGERTVKRVKSFGADMLNSANEYTGEPGDHLFYRGFWYECMSSVQWDHTMLGHYRSEFTIIREQDEPPKGV